MSAKYTIHFNKQPDPAVSWVVQDERQHLFGSVIVYTPCRFVTDLSKSPQGWVETDGCLQANGASAVIS